MEIFEYYTIRCDHTRVGSVRQRMPQCTERRTESLSITFMLQSVHYKKLFNNKWLELRIEEQKITTHLIYEHVF